MGFMTCCVEKLCTFYCILCHIDIITGKNIYTDEEGLKITRQDDSIHLAISGDCPFYLPTKSSRKKYTRRTR